MVLRVQHRAVGQRRVVEQRPPEELRLQVGAAVGRVGLDVLDPDAEGGAAVVLADDQLLGDVDEAAGQVARVGGPQGGVDEALAGAGRGDEVLQGLETLAEVLLDRAGDHVAAGVGDEAAHARDLTHLRHVPAGARADHHVDRVEALGLELVLHRLLHLGRGVGPDAHLLLAALAVGDDAAAELRLDLLGLGLVAVEDVALAGRGLDVVDRHRQARLRGVAVAEVLDGVERRGDHRLGVVVRQALHDEPHLALADHRRDVAEALGVVVGQGLLEDGAADGGLHRLTAGDAHRDGGVEVETALVVGPHGLPQVAEHAPLALGAGGPLGQVEGADHEVLGRGHDRATGRRRQDVVGRQHEHPGLGLGLGRQRHVDGHLVAVEVGVERRAHERVDLQGLALDEHRLEGLDAEAVQRGRPVQQHRVLLDDVLEDVPHRGPTTLDHALGRLDVLGQLEVDEPLHHERLEQLQRHQLGQAALVQPQRRAGDDDRTAGVVDALAEQVLTEPALLALEHVRQRLQRAVARPGDRAAAATVVEQGVDGLLQHPLLVVDDDLRRAEREQAAEAVVAVDHPAVQVVEVRGGEAATVELDHRAQLGRDHRHDVEDHRLGVVAPAAVLVATVERGDDLQPLDRLLLALGRQRLAPGVARIDGGAELDLLLVEVDAVDQLLDGVGAGATLEVVAVLVAQLAPQHLVVEDLARVEVLELVPRAGDEVELDVVALAQGLDVTVGVAAQLLGVATLALEPLGLLLELLEPAVDRQLLLLLDGVALFEVLVLEVLQVLVALVLVDPRDEVGGEVDDLLELLGLELLLGLDAGEQVGQPRPGAAEVPDVDDRGLELDVAHAVTADLRARHLDAAALADDALEADPLVLAAVALPVPGRAEDLLAEEPVLLRPQRAVVDGLRLLDLAVGPGADLIRRGQPDLELVEHVHIEHVMSVLACSWVRVL